jgi:hypothetical protein
MQPFLEPSEHGKMNYRTTSRKNNQNRRKNKNYYPELKNTDIWKDPWRNKEYEDQLKEDQHRQQHWTACRCRECRWHKD